MIGNLAHDGMASVVYADDQVLLLFGQSEDALGPAREAAGRAGCRIAAETRLADAPARLDRQIIAHAALVVAQTPSDDLTRLLDRLDAEARSGRLRSIIVAPEGLIDLVTANGFHFGVDHLIDPSSVELQAATAPTPQQVNEAGRSSGIGILQQLSEEAARIAAVLAALSEDRGEGLREPAPQVSGGVPPIETGFVRSIIRARRLRDHFMHGGLFADPAWDMMLDLMAARLEGNRVAVSSLCIAAAVPATTALRWIKALTDRQLFVRSADPQDGRRVYIELADDIARAMSLYLAAVQRSGVTAI